MDEREVTVALFARLAGVGRNTVAKYVEELLPPAAQLQAEDPAFPALPPVEVSRHTPRT